MNSKKIWSDPESGVLVSCNDGKDFSAEEKFATLEELTNSESARRFVQIWPRISPNPQKLGVSELLRVAADSRATLICVERKVLPMSIIPSG